VDAKGHAVALGNQRLDGHRDSLGRGVERGDLGRRILAQRVESQALGGAALQRGGKRRRSLLVVAKDADQEHSALAPAGERGGGLEHRRGGVVGVIERQKRRSVALPRFGEGRQGGLGDLAAAGVEDRGALAPDLGRELCDEPRLADPRGTPDQDANGSALARALPAPTQPAKLALAPGEQRRAALELDGELEDRRRRVEARVLGEDLLLESAQPGPGLDPDLLDQGLARLAVGVEGLGLAPRAIEGEHALGVKALAQRLLGDERLEPCDRLGVAPGGELGVDRQFERPHAKLLEATDLRPGERLGGDVGEWGAAPELERGTGETVRGTRWLAGGLLDQLLEAQRVDRALGQTKLVAAPAGEDLGLGAALAERLAKPRDVELGVLGGGRRGVVTPEPVGQLISAEGRVGAQREQRDDAALLASPQGQGLSVD
jgi:hypothetical protein